MFVTTSSDHVMVVSEIADRIFAAIGPGISSFPRWSAEKQMDVLAKAFPLFGSYPPEGQQRMFYDVVHYVETASFATH